MMLLVLLSLATVPLWPMYDGEPSGGRGSDTVGYYSEKDVPVVKWTAALKDVGKGRLSVVVGGQGDVIMIDPGDDNNVIAVGSDGLVQSGWKTRLPSPALWLILSADGSTLYTIVQNSTLLMNPTTGSILQTWPAASPPSSTIPAVSDPLNGLIILTHTHYITTLSLSSGEPVWNITVSDCSLTSPPIISDNVLVYHCVDGGVGYALFVSPRYGTLLGKQLKLGGITTPTSRALNPDKDVAFISGDGLVVAVSCVSFTVLWKQSLGTVKSTPMFVLPSGDVICYYSSSVIMFNSITGETKSTTPTTNFTIPNDKGLIDSKGTLYGMTQDSTRVAVLSYDNIEWGYEPLNCSVPGAVKGTTLSVLAGPSGSVYMFVSYSNSIRITRIGRQSYPTCSSIDKCTCSGAAGYKLGPRTCAWCDTTNSCIEVTEGTSKGVYQQCPSVNRLPCGGVGGVRRYLSTPGTPSDIRGTWRSIPIEEGALSQETKYVFTDSTVSINGSSSHPTTHDSNTTVSYTVGKDTFNCVFESLPPGPQTRNTLLACGGPNQPAPLSPEIAMCAKDGAEVLFAVKCIVPAVQKPPCDFDDDGGVLGKEVETGQCGDTCKYFSDCPSNCGCAQGTSGGLCCGGGTCPTPAPTPPSPPSPPSPPTPTPPPSPSTHCGKTCSSDTDCSSSEGLCTSCDFNKCTSLCGDTCQSSSDCSSSCPYCNSTGKCQAKAATCLSTCVNNNDCTEECPTCFAVSPNPGKCGANCGDKCTSSSQCLGGGNCGTCVDGKCGSVPPPSTTYVCDTSTGNPTCSLNATVAGYPKATCESICGVQPSGKTPVGLMGSWLGVNIKKGFTKGEWVFAFSDTNVVAKESGVVKMTFEVMMLGPGLFFRSGNTNHTALWGLASSAGSDAKTLTLAISPPGGPLPIDFTGPMTDGPGVFALLQM